jgi:hypothetical protein
MRRIIRIRPAFSSEDFTDISGRALSLIKNKKNKKFF